MAIFIVSDLHLAHSKEFIYGARGFENVEDMNKAIIHKWNEIVDEEDDVYVLGDLVMGPEVNLQMLRRQKKTAILRWTVLWLNVLKVWVIKMGVIFCSV